MDFILDKLVHLLGRSVTTVTVTSFDMGSTLDKVKCLNTNLAAECLRHPPDKWKGQVRISFEEWRAILICLRENCIKTKLL